MIEVLTQHLVSWLQSAVPEVIEVVTSGPGVIELRDPSGAYMIFEPGSLMDQPGRPIHEGLEVAVYSVLSGAQDFVIEELREPWPATPHKGNLALPRVEIAESECSAGYSLGEEWIMRMPPLKWR